MSALKVTDKTFSSDVVSSSIPVLVDCWAEWCAPCRAVGPTIDKLATEFKGKFKICKLNVDENRATASKYQITSIPTMLIFKNGKVVDGLIGAHPERNIREKLTKWM
ncbi:MAG: thioredoxin [Candidatus Delongbacteria bacterium]|nr:thioredoxin [Candidatus Delongbacteria bacterium]MBN2836589.1 thioredoxin [Candidatus Delongbacteria bacterium]